MSDASPREISKEALAKYRSAVKAAEDDYERKVASAKKMRRSEASAIRRAAWTERNRLVALAQQRYRHQTTGSKLPKTLSRRSIRSDF